MRRLAMILACGAMVGTGLVAGQQPKLSGTWTLESSRGGGPSGVRTGGAAVATARASAGAVQSGGASTTEIVVSQTADTVTFDQRINELDRKHVYKLDGSESVNTNGNVTTRTRSRWEGQTLVTEGTLTVSTTTGAVTAALTQRVEVDAEGKLTIVNKRKPESGAESTSTQVYVRKE